MTQRSKIRSERARRFRRRARSVLQEQGLNRASLGTVLSDLKGLAAERELWSVADFPDPAPDERQARYLIEVDDDSTFALYLNVMRPGKVIPPHDHTTWACIAAVEGEELNALYRRLDAGDVPGRAQIALAEEVVVGPGGGVALMPDDIHAVTIGGEQLIRHLHMYGMALETLTGRQVFDPLDGTCRPMDIGVATRRVG